MSDMKKVGRVGGKALLYFEIVSTFALLIGLGAAHLLKPGHARRQDAAIGGSPYPIFLARGRQLGQCSLGTGCRVHRLERRRHGAALLPTGVFQTVPDQMQVCSVVSGNTAAKGLFHALEAVGDRNQVSCVRRNVRSLNTFIQNFAPSMLSIHRPRMSRLPSGSTPKAR